jgi:hypothetical protein
MMVEFGWRGRGIALAALGAVVLSRSVFALTRSGGLIPIEMQSLVYLALANEHSLPSAPGVELGSLVVSLFERWPPAVPDVDDATG